MSIGSVCKKIRAMLMLRFAEQLQTHIEDEEEPITRVEPPKDGWFDRLLRWLYSLDRQPPQGRGRCGPHARVTAAEDIPPLHYDPDQKVKRR